MTHVSKALGHILTAGSARLGAAGQAVFILHTGNLSAEPPEGAEPSDAPPPWEGGSPPLPKLWEVLWGRGMG